LLDKEALLNEAVLDRYDFVRDAYLQHRQSLIYEGNPPREKYEDEEDDSKPDSSKPDKHSANDGAERGPPAASAVSPVAAPVVAGNSDGAMALPPVYRIWTTSPGEMR